MKSPFLSVQLIKIVCGLILGFSLLMESGCAQVKPWQRGDLAREEMAWQTDPMEAALQSHIYFSKEASTGGASTGGGGCGCN
jgi:hypothetical protein